jgi:tetratricopeptide (TPR) repeat protein
MRSKRGRLTRRRKNQEALVEYDKAIKANPKLAEAYFNRGNAHYDLGQNQQALKDYGEAIRLNPKDGEAYFNRANVYRRLKQDQPALNDYSAAIKLSPMKRAVMLTGAPFISTPSATTARSKTTARRSASNPKRPALFQPRQQLSGAR